MGKIRTRNSGKRRNPGSVNISFPYSANSENQVLIVTIFDSEHRTWNTTCVRGGKNIEYGEEWCGKKVSQMGSNALRMDSMSRKTFPW